MAGATGGLSYAASAISHATRAVDITSAKPSPGLVASVSSACSQYAVAPIVTGVTPSSGPAGTKTVITGSHFSTPSAITSVLFNGVSASFTIDSDTQLTAIMPAAAKNGVITVSNCKGSVLGGTFTITSAGTHSGTSCQSTVIRWVDTSRTITLPDGTREPRPVTTEFWYPPAGDRSRPFPLIVFGHGFASTPSQYERLLCDWAAAGYVVAAPIFPLTNANAPGGPDKSDLVNQPRDMKFVITRVLAGSASSTGPLSGLVDRTEIAVAGHSDGGKTAFAAAYERTFSDHRIRAALILSGAILAPSHDAKHTGIPLLAVQGTADRINPLVDTRDLFRAVGRPKFLLLLRGAGHLAPYTVPGPTFTTMEQTTIAFLAHYLGHGPLAGIATATHGLPSAELTSDP